MPAKKTRSKNKTGATRNTEQSASKLSLLVIGLLVGSFIAFLIYLDKIPTDGEKQTVSNKQQNQQSSAQKNASKQSKPVKHQFDFYTVLPDREVEIIDIEDKKPVRKTAIKPKPALAKKSPIVPQSSGLYQLQVGAFTELSKADAMKARLAFLGVESNIQVIQNNGQKMYRVRVGPSTDSRKIEQIKQQLKAQNINAFVQKLSG